MEKNKVVAFYPETPPLAYLEKCYPTGQQEVLSCHSSTIIGRQNLILLLCTEYISCLHPKVNEATKVNLIPKKASPKCSKVLHPNGSTSSILRRLRKFLGQSSQLYGKFVTFPLWSPVAWRRLTSTINVPTTCPTVMSFPLEGSKDCGMPALALFIAPNWNESSSCNEQQLATISSRYGCWN